MQPRRNCRNSPKSRPALCGSISSEILEISSPSGLFFVAAVPPAAGVKFAKIVDIKTNVHIMKLDVTSLLAPVMQVVRKG